MGSNEFAVGGAREKRRVERMKKFCFRRTMLEKIHDMPQEDRPREKLARLGAGHLEGAELLALFLRTGVKGKSAIELGRDLLRKYGSLGALARLGVEDLSREKGLGLAKASQLIAVFELGARVARETVQGRALTQANEIYDFLFPQMVGFREEHAWILLVDTRMRLLQQIEVSVGSLNATIVHPREILRHALLHSAYGFLLVHNHPSGDPAPSAADEKITRQLQEAANLLQIAFVDHLIIGKPSADGRKGYFSFHEYGRM